MIYLVILYAICYVAIACYFARSDGFFSIVPVFGLAAFYYYAAIPLELYLTGQTHVQATAWMSYAIYPEDCTRIGLMALLALLGFSLGYGCSGFRLHDGTPASTTAVAIPAPLLWLGGTAATFILIKSGLGFISILTDYRGGNELRYANPAFNAMLHYVVLTLAIMASVLYQGNRQQKLTALLLAGSIAYWGIFTGDKNPICQAVFAVAAGYVGERSRSFTAFAAVILGFYITVLGLPVFSAYRANAGLGVAEVVRNFTVLETDARGPMASLAVEMHNGQPHRLGSTYPLAAACLLPRIVYPTRPPDLAEQFAFENIPTQLWYGGMGMGYSLMTEAYVNFGVMGALIQYFLIGLLIGKAFTAARYLLRDEPNDSILRALYACCGLVCVVIMHRGATNQIGRILIYYGLVPLIALSVSKILGLYRSACHQPFPRDEKHANSLAS